MRHAAQVLQRRARGVRNRTERVRVERVAGDLLREGEGEGDRLLLDPGMAGLGIREERAGRAGEPLGRLREPGRQRGLRLREPGRDAGGAAALLGLRRRASPPRPGGGNRCRRGSGSPASCCVGPPVSRRAPPRRGSC
jgi:hypothetical protein